MIQHLRCHSMMTTYQNSTTHNLVGKWIPILGFLTIANGLQDTSALVDSNAECIWREHTDPNVGNLFCNGSWPPSNPGLTPPPDRDFCPLSPRPAVLPRLDPYPRPTLWGVRREFTPGLRSFSLISLLLYLD